MPDIFRKIKKQLKFKKKHDIITESAKCGQNAGIAQSVEHFTRNEGVVSSSLISGLLMKSAIPAMLRGCVFY